MIEYTLDGKLNYYLIRAKFKRQHERWTKTEEYKNWKENPTEENLKKAKEKRKEIIK